MTSQIFKFISFLLIRCGVCLSVILLIAQCAHTQGGGDDPDSLYKEAEEAFADERYLVALEKYRDIKNRFPYSSKATESELRIADTYFAQESYLEAESAYEVFKELHPTHPRSDYVQYRIGLSYYRQIPSNSTRDLSAAHHAISAFDDLLKRFPSSKYIKEAKQLTLEAKGKLAEYENYVADFYFQRKHYLSASYRYAALLQEYPNLGYDEEALYKLGESYFRIRMFSNAKDTLRRLITKYPNSTFKSESLALLKKIDKKP